MPTLRACSSEARVAQRQRLESRALARRQRAGRQRQWLDPLRRSPPQVGRGRTGKVPRASGRLSVSCCACQPVHAKPPLLTHVHFRCIAAAPAGPNAPAVPDRAHSGSAGPASCGPTANGTAAAGKPTGPAAPGAAAANGRASDRADGPAGGGAAPVARGPGRPPAGPRKPKGAAVAMVGGALAAAAGAGQTPEQQAAAFSNQPAIQQLCMQVRARVLAAPPHALRLSQPCPCASPSTGVPC